MKIFILIMILTVIVGGYFFFGSQRKNDSFGARKKNIVITSSSFKEGQEIPLKYSCEGDNISPQISLDNVPSDAKSLVLVMDDPDTDAGVFTHWLVWNIDPKITETGEGMILPKSVTGKNDFGSERYEGPCPAFGKHRYFIKVFALDKILDLESGLGLSDLQNAMQKHILDSGEMQGYYVKKLK